MTREPPQVQSIISSKNISDEGAKKILSKFLIQQKSFFDDDKTADGDAVKSDENVFDMEEEDGQGTLEEIHARLEGIFRSLSGIKNPGSANSPEAATRDKKLTLATVTNGDDKSDDEELVEVENRKIKGDNGEEDTTPMNPAQIEKRDKKAAKKAEKEARKSAKRAEKEARKSAKKAEKEAKKSAKKAAKEVKKSAKKEKKKRKHAEEDGSKAKRVKTEN